MKQPDYYIEQFRSKDNPTDYKFIQLPRLCDLLSSIYFNSVTGDKTIATFRVYLKPDIRGFRIGDQVLVKFGKYTGLTGTISALGVANNVKLTFNINLHNSRNTGWINTKNLIKLNK